MPALTFTFGPLTFVHNACVVIVPRAVVLKLWREKAPVRERAGKLDLLFQCLSKNLQLKRNFKAVSSWKQILHEKHNSIDEFQPQN